MPPKHEVDPEELMRRKFLAKCRFRVLVRLAIQNAYWLIEGVDEYTGLDVKRRVEQAVRTKNKDKQLLTINDKALLNKYAPDRTQKEQIYLYRILGDLKCFKRYPNNVKRRLAAATYFRYYGPNRVVIRQGHPAEAMYFIVTGGVVVSHMVYDAFLKEHVSVDICTLTAGDVFGEVALLHDIKRSATVTTNSHCELLTLLKEDFKNVLRTLMQKQWDEVRQAMSAFTYFERLDEITIRDGCIVAKMKSYKANETLLGDGEGVPNFVYFVLTGRCQMIESMQVFVTKRLGREYYTLYDPYIPEEDSEQDLDKKIQSYEVKREKMQTLERISGRPELHGVLKLSGSTKLDVRRDISVVDPIPRSSHESDDSAKHVMHPREPSTRFSVRMSASPVGGVSMTRQKKKDMDLRTYFMQIPEEDSEQDLDKKIQSYEVKREKMQTLERISGRPELHGVLKLSGSTKLDVRRDISVVDPIPRSSHESDDSAKHVMHPREPSTRFSVRMSASPVGGVSMTRQKKKDMDLRTYFMQVVVFNPGSTFGFGENMRDRRIIALTPVSCLLLPKIWLLQHNCANIWTRIQHYLEKSIPTKAKLFKEFVSEQRWKEFREEMVSDVVARTNTVNFTSIHDVPYSVRLEEIMDL